MPERCFPRGWGSLPSSLLAGSFTPVETRALGTHCKVPTRGRGEPPTHQASARGVQSESAERKRGARRVARVQGLGRRGLPAIVLASL